MDEAETKLWRDFAHTVRVMTARALADHEARNWAAQPDDLARVYDVRLLAAAGDSLVLPKGEILADGGALGSAIEETAEGLRVTLQLKGFAALRSGAGRKARLLSANGAIDYAFRFSTAGTAVCILANTHDVRDGLAGFSVHVLQ